VIGDRSRRRLAGALPFYYGWVVLAAAALTSYSSRPLMAATTLSVFVVPMTEHFGWSRGLFSGALSLGGLCAVAISPVVGKLIDRYGSGVVLAVTTAVIGGCAVGLSLVNHAWAFYSLYVPGRALFAIPLELGTATAVSNWFLRRRPLALAVLSATQGVGLAAMPLIAQVIIGGWSWRVAWASLGLSTITIAVLPTLLLIARRPEDMGLELDPRPVPAILPVGGPSGVRPAASVALAEEDFTVREALHSRAFWALAAFASAAFVVQGGVILHQVPHFINQGLSASTAALTASTFAISQVLGGLVWSIWARRVPIRFLLSLTGLCVTAGAMGTAASGSLGWGMAAATALGIGMGGVHLLLRLVWADYYGRTNLASIRGLTLPMQIAGQTIGPITSGYIFDATGTYRWAFFGFGSVASLGALIVLAAARPKKPEVPPES
jgi:MFS family permease